MARFAIITLGIDNALLVSTANTFGDAIDVIVDIKSSLEDGGVSVKVAGTYQYPRYVKSPRCGRTFPTSISCGDHFYYIKKVEDGECIDTIVEMASERRRKSHSESFRERAYYSHSKKGSRMSTAEREEYDHCMAMGDFDF